MASKHMSAKFLTLHAPLLHLTLLSTISGNDRMYTAFLARRKWSAPCSSQAVQARFGNEQGFSASAL